MSKDEMKDETKVDVIAIITVQIFEFADNEDGVTYRWNATEGRQRAEARRVKVVPIHLADLGMTPVTILRYAPDLDTNKAMRLPGSALLSPLVFVEHRDKHVLIDGWHRLYKAAMLRVPVLPAYVLSKAEADAIRVTE